LDSEDEKPWLDSPMLTINSLLGAGAFSAVLFTALEWIIFRNSPNGHLWVQAAGSIWSWLVYALVASGAYFLLWKRLARLPLHLLGMLSMAVVGVIACSVESISSEDGFLALMFLSGLYACVWVWTNLLLDPQHPPRWLTCVHDHQEGALYAILAGASAVFLGSFTLFTGKHPVWSAESILLSACACTLLAYQRKTEIWASLATLLVMLASTILVLHFGQEKTHLLLLAIQVNLAVLGAMALLRLGLHRFLVPPAVEQSQLRHLQAQIGLGILTNLV